MAAKRTRSNHKKPKWRPGAVMAQPQSPVGKVRTKKGKIVNLGLADPTAPSWRNAPFTGSFNVP